MHFVHIDQQNNVFLLFPANYSAFPNNILCFFKLLFRFSLYVTLIMINYLLNQVRKEKLGDRIAALQQLVAPFGKVRLYILVLYIIYIVIY